MSLFPGLRCVRVSEAVEKSVGIRFRLPRNRSRFREGTERPSRSRSRPPRRIRHRDRRDYPAWSVRTRWRLSRSIPIFRPLFHSGRKRNSVSIFPSALLPSRVRHVSRWKRKVIFTSPVIAGEKKNTFPNLNAVFDLLKPDRFCYSSARILHIPRYFFILSVSSSGPWKFSIIPDREPIGTFPRRSAKRCRHRRSVLRSNRGGFG